MYAETQGRMLELAVQQLIKNVREFVRRWVGEGLISGDWEMNHFMEVSSTSAWYLCVNGKIPQNICDGLGAVWDCCI